MTKVAVVVLAVMVAALAMAAAVHGQSTSDCQTQATGLSTCLPYLLPGNTSAPDALCCSPLQSLLSSSSATCLCNLTSLAQNLGITINISRAPEIAASCNTTVPDSVLECFNATGVAPPPPSPSSVPPPPGSQSSSSKPEGNKGFAVVPEKKMVIWAVGVSMAGMLLLS